MEARSLTILNELAANPPQYPEKPADEAKDPLTLYISRVPGTRDVILSTLKPQERNVTGEDVTNSLYYIHLEMPDDHAKGLESVCEENKWRSSEESGSSPLTIHRKPVADPARALTPDGLANGTRLPPLQPVISTSLNPPRLESLSAADGLGRDTRPSLESPDMSTLPSIHGQPGVDPPPNRKAVHERTAAGLHTGMPTRKPVGPRPMSEVPVASSKPTQPLDNLFPADTADGSHEHPDKQLPVLPLETPVPQAGGVQQGSFAHSNASRSQAATTAHSRSPSPRNDSITSINGNGTPFTLTIVRRDPSSRSQWNVGKVSSRQLDPVNAGDEGEAQPASTWGHLSAPLLHPHPSINIELENSGYAKFRTMSRKKNSLAENGLDAALAAMTRSNASDRNTSRGEFGVFSRQLLMEYSQSFAKKLRKTIQRLEQTGLNKLTRHRSDSVGSVASNASEKSDNVEAVATDGLPPPGMKPRGYVFLSPWGGKCDFQTGQAGRSLVCRHTPQELGTSSNYNPLVASHGPAKFLASSGKTVSELRFNLPSSELFVERGEQWKGNLERIFKQDDGSLGNNSCNARDDGAVSPFGLNLGSERAGGGNRGKTAKLGKLIIHDEGLKMLDLVVAANMGIWWGAWEKSF